MKELFVYVHIPYCLKRCSFCDFAILERGKTKEDSEDYINLLKKETHLKQPFFKDFKVQTVYFGGGTPSLIPGEQILSVIKELKNCFAFSKEPEISIEINPGTLTEEKRDCYKLAQINRYSLGVQTFKQEFLKQSNRGHSVEDSLHDLLLFQKEGLNFSLDLMFALPEQNLFDLKKDVKKALNFNPSHISLYHLTVPDSHKLSQNRASDEEQTCMMKWISQTLSNQGLRRYEISNFAAQGHKSQHNLAYWEGKTVLGLGLSAHSYLGQKDFSESHEDEFYGIRFWNSPHIKTYANSLQKANRLRRNPFEHLPNRQIERLKVHEALTDFCHTRLRKTGGFYLREFSALFPKRIKKQLLLRLWKMQKEGYIEEQKGCFHLTEKGQLLSNQVFLSLTFLEKDFIFYKRDS